jgi:hypothetical protein
MRPAIVALLAAFAVSLSSPAVNAQVHGTPTSVTSIGFGGHYNRAPGIPPSVTSLGPLGYTAGDHVYRPACCFNPSSPANINRVPRPVGSHRPHRSSYFGPEIYAVPYAMYYGPDDTADDQEAEPDQAPGPTVFDRRGAGESSAAAEDAYDERMRSQPPEQAGPAVEPAAEAAPEAEQTPTVLVFKDGRQREVENYAVLGGTLYDMTPGQRSKIALADLDLSATAKANDDRGVDFRMPAQPAAN